MKNKKGQYFLISDLLRLINQKYNIAASAIKPFGPVWQVDSTKGRFALKRTGCSVKQLVCTTDALFKLKKSGFDSTILPEISAENLPYFQYKNHNYQLFQWRQGRHPSFHEPEFIRRCADLFARLHRYSMVIDIPPDCELPDLIANLQKKAAFLERLILDLKSRPHLNRVDRRLIYWSDHFLIQAGFSISGLRNMMQLPNCRPLTGFCHNDPAPRNIIIENGVFFLIDFELSAWGLLITEVAKLAGRVLQANNWRQEVFNLVIEGYSQTRTLTEWELNILLYLLCFPNHFWRICSQRWEEKLKWSERRFAAKLWKIANEEWSRQYFLKSHLPELPLTDITVLGGKNA